MECFEVDLVSKLQWIPKLGKRNYLDDDLGTGTMEKFVKSNLYLFSSKQRRNIINCESQIIEKNIVKKIIEPRERIYEEHFIGKLVIDIINDCDYLRSL